MSSVYMYSRSCSQPQLRLRSDFRKALGPSVRSPSLFANGPTLEADEATLVGAIGAVCAPGCLVGPNEAHLRLGPR